MGGKLSSLNEAMDEDFLFLVFFIICIGLYDENRKLSSDTHVSFALYSFNKNSLGNFIMGSFIFFEYIKEIAFIVFQNS